MHNIIGWFETETHTADCGYPDGACGVALYTHVGCTCGESYVIGQAGNFSSVYATQYTGEDIDRADEHFGAQLLCHEVEEKYPHLSAYDIFIHSDEDEEDIPPNNYVPKERNW